MDGILTSIKNMLGITEEYTQFDTNLIIHINSVFMILKQLGVGPENGFSITDKTQTWDQYLTTSDLEAVKTYVYLKVRLIFDPPNSSVVTESINRTISELEWRIQAITDN